MLVPKSLVYFLRLLVGHCGHRSLSKKCLFPPISTFLSFPYTQPKAEQILLCRCHGTRGGPLWSFCKLHMHTYVFLSLCITFVNAVSQAILYLITVLRLLHQDVGWAEARKKKTYLTETAELCDSHWCSYCRFLDLCHQQIDHLYGDVCGGWGRHSVADPAKVSVMVCTYFCIWKNNDFKTNFWGRFLRSCGTILTHPQS